MEATAPFFSGQLLLAAPVPELIPPFTCASLAVYSSVSCCAAAISSCCSICASPAASLTLVVGALAVMALMV